MSEKWYCKKCDDYCEPEYAVNFDECPICGSTMVYPKPKPITINGICQRCNEPCDNLNLSTKEAGWFCKKCLREEEIKQKVNFT